MVTTQVHKCHFSFYYNNPSNSSSPFILSITIILVKNICHIFVFIFYSNNRINREDLNSNHRALDPAHKKKGEKNVHLVLCCVFWCFLHIQQHSKLSPFSHWHAFLSSWQAFFHGLTFLTIRRAGSIFLIISTHPVNQHD